MSERIFIIGAGNVGRGLAQAFRAAGMTIVGLHARRPQSGAQHDATSVGEYPEKLADANVIVIAVRDPDIDGVCTSLVELAKRYPQRIARGTVIVHTSGATDPPTFAILHAMGFAVGTFHPLVPFATPERGAQLLSNAWVGIDGDPNACAASRRLAVALGARTVNIPPGSKGIYHAAAVFASNFPIVLAGIASQLLANSGVSARAAEQVVQSLMSGAVANLEYGSPASVLTGPAVRGDMATIQKHLRALQPYPMPRAVYDILTQAAATLAAKRPLVDDARFGGRGEDERGLGE